MFAGCSHGSSRDLAGAPAAAPGPATRALDAAMVAVPAGAFIAGSTVAEREQAYADQRAGSGSDRARRFGFFDREAQRHTATTGAFLIDRTPVTVAAWAEFVAAGGAPAPDRDLVTRAFWKRQRLVHRYDDIQRFLWPAGAARRLHPAVLVSHAEAARYCRWRGARLPTALEWEKAARGPDGFFYPWGDTWRPELASSSETPPRDTVPVGGLPAGASPYGVLDMGGLVFEWTATPWPGDPDRIVVKGGAWDDHGGFGRGAAVQPRPRALRHVIVGFRCARSP